MTRLFDTQCPSCKKWWMSDLKGSSCYERHFCPSCRDMTNHLLIYLDLRLKIDQHNNQQSYSE
jgi:hypothetical protein